MNRTVFNITQLVGRVTLILGVFLMMQQKSIAGILFYVGFAAIVISLLYLAVYLMRSALDGGKKALYLAMMFLPALLVFLLVKDTTWMKYFYLALAIMVSNAAATYFIMPKLTVKDE